MKCNTCSHPQRQAIDLALLAENHTFEALSREYGLSISSLFRHKKHLTRQMVRAQEKLQQLQRQETLFQYNDFLQDAREQARTAKEAGNTRLALQAIRQGTQILNFITRLDVQLDQDTTYRLLASPQWLAQDSLFPTDPRFKADCRLTLADFAFSPCPELPPDPQVDAWDLEDATAADQDRHAHLETSQNLQLEAKALLQGLLTCVRAPENEPQSKREKSAKLPKNPPLFLKNIHLFQEVNASDKNLPKKPHVGRESEAPPANMASEAPPAATPVTLAATPNPPKKSSEPGQSPNGLLPRLQRALSAKLLRRSRPSTAMQKQCQPVSQRQKPLSKNPILLPFTRSLAKIKKIFKKLRPKRVQPPPVAYREEYDNLIYLDTGRYLR